MISENSSLARSVARRFLGSAPRLCRDAVARVLATLKAEPSPTSDPGVNSYADADFLRARIKAHIDGIRSSVLASVPSAKFELLWPYDVNYPTSNQYNVGGQLNRYVNLPAEYLQKAGSGLDRLKVEALSFGSQERNFDKARQAINFAMTSPGSWNASDVAYLVPWFNGGCPWVWEYLCAADNGLVLVAFWAFDHLNAFGWPLPLPVRAPSLDLY